MMGAVLDPGKGPDLLRKSPGLGLHGPFVFAGLLAPEKFPLHIGLPELLPGSLVGETLRLGWDKRCRRAANEAEGWGGRRGRGGFSGDALDGDFGCRALEVSASRDKPAGRFLG